MKYSLYVWDDEHAKYYFRGSYSVFDEALKRVDTIENAYWKIMDNDSEAASGYQPRKARAYV